MSPLEWWNFIFTAPGFIAVVYLLILFFGAGVDTDADTDFDVEATDAIDADGLETEGISGDDSGGEDVDDEVEASSSWVLSLFHIEHRRLVSYALAMSGLCWGVIGYLVNVKIVIELPGILFIPALAGNVVVTGLVSIMLVRTVMPYIAKTMASDEETKPIMEEDFVGSVARVSTYLSVDSPGMIIIEGPSGINLKKKAVLINHDGPPLRRNEEVLIIDYKNGVYEVTQYNKLVESSK